MGGRARVVIQSRLGSSRLPGKAMLSLAGQPMVVLAARRAAGLGADVVVATSTEPEDDVLAGAVRAAGFEVVRGPLADPLARFVIATRDLAATDVVVRLTADNVFPDGALVAELVEAVRSGRRPYARVGGDDPSVPYGVAGEAFTVAALREADLAPDANREHVTPWIRKHHGESVLAPADLPKRWRGLRCTVDTLDDYVRVARLFAGVPDPVAPSWRELCDLLLQQGAPAEEWPASKDNVLGQSPMILGTVQLGLAYGAANRQGMPTDEEAQAILREAAAAGVSHVDTARAYGLSEQRIGQGLARGLSEAMGVVTKVAPLDDVPTDADPGWCTSAVHASVAASLRHLRTDRVDALLLHRSQDWDKGAGAVRRALLSLRDEGTCRVVGVSVGNVPELVAALQDAECGYVQLPFNLLDWRWTSPEVGDILASRPDVVVTCRSVFLQGLLLGDEQLAWPSNCGVGPSEVLGPLHKLVDELGRVSVADLCIAYVLGHPWATSVVLGADTPRQVRETASVARRKPLDHDQIVHVRQNLPHVDETLLDPARWTW